MKKQSSFRKTWVCLAAALALLGRLNIGQAAVTNAAQIAAAITLRPLTPSEINIYGLTNITAYGITNGMAQVSAGLSTVALGEPVYVDAMASFNALTSNNVVGIGWSLSKPNGSSATLSAGLLGPNVPLYKTSDNWNPYIGGASAGNDNPTVTNNSLVGRIYFRPDVTGQYVVSATITNQWKTSTSTTNLSVTIYGATYLGLQTCASCHSGYFPNIINTYTTYTNTPHASFFTRAIDGLVSSHYSQNCISCHVLGYDVNSFAVNGGFDDEARIFGWTFPTVLTNGNWATMPADLQNLANIQCENCHGPGSEHVKYTGGIPANTNAISKSYAAGDCSQCHDSLTGYYRSAEWNNSLHAASAHQTGSTCVRCHTGPGFVGWANAGGMSAQIQYPTNVIASLGLSTNILTTTPISTYEAITCQACHDPHDASNPHQLRLGYNVVLSDGTVVTNAGSGGLCMQCHNMRNGSYTNMMASYPTYNGIDGIVTNYTPTGFSVVNLTNRVNHADWAGGTTIGTHDSPQADIFEGVNAETYGKVIASGPHAKVIADTCAGCHMQTIPTTVVVNGVTNANPAFTQAGGHTFKMSYINSQGAKVPVTDVCAPCHGAITNFDMLVPDYAGIGQPMGIQSQVQVLLKKLSTLLPPRTYQANPANYAADGLIKVYDNAGAWTDGNIANYTNLPMKYLRGYHNFNIVYRDNSWGVHNAQYAVGLLKASIADLTGDANGDGLPDAWQKMVYGLGFATNPAAAYNAYNNGYPNWMWASMNLNPLSSFMVSGNSGSIYFNNGAIANGQTNIVAIFKAAEIVFNTQVGTTYTIQAANAMTGGWQNISTNIPGTGYSVSYLVPTRYTNQMFYRVGHTP